MQNLQNQLLTSQQTIIELTSELEDAHSMLSLKENDCTRLARELGASQVREAQEKARLNQELRKTMQENDFKVSQKAEEVYEWELFLFCTNFRRVVTSFCITIRSGKYILQSINMMLCFTKFVYSI